MRFVGVDLTSAFSAAPRAVDIAVLDDELHCSFFTTFWPSPALVEARDVIALTTMLTGTLSASAAETVWAIDGPQALAAPGELQRACEGELATPGRTPDTLPSTTSTAPFATFIRSSIDLFAALLSVPGTRLGGAAGVSMTTATLFEMFPGAEWGVIAGQRLPGKASLAGKAARRSLFEHLGIRDLPVRPTADQNDALVGAWLAWCTRHAPERVALAGTPPTSDDDGVLREGCILHATGKARALGFVVVPDAEAPGAGFESALPDASTEWSGGDALLLRLNDTGLVHGNHPENAWLAPMQSYELETLAPFQPVRISLEFAQKFPGGRAWTARPTVPALLKQLGETRHPSKAHPLSLPVRIVAE